MSDAGKFLIVVGLVILLAGVAVWGLGRVGFRGLPGDIRYESDRVGVYFPIVTCLALSLVLTLLMWLWRWISDR